MHDHETPLFARDDTMLGACQGLGEELGINPAIFRVALGLGLFWNWEAVLIGYVAAAVAINLFRWFVPLHRAQPTQAPPTVSTGDNDDTALPLAEAA